MLTLPACMNAATSPCTIIIHLAVHFSFWTEKVFGKISSKSESWHLHCVYELKEKWWICYWSHTECVWFTAQCSGSSPAAQSVRTFLFSPSVHQHPLLTNPEEMMTVSSVGQHAATHRLKFCSQTQFESFARRFRKWHDESSGCS